MEVLIIEDEKAAVRNLKALLQEVVSDFSIVGETDSIADTIDWFSNSPMPDLIFMDIHLADGSAFEIFSHIKVKCPVIFTTAYDEYALKAFKVNSIDYLLKPIGKRDISQALEKLKDLRGESGGNSASDVSGYDAILHAFKRQASYKSHFLLPVKGDKLLPLPVEVISFFYIDEGIVKGVLAEGREHIFTQTLDELTDSLDPACFFRVNRQYLVARKAIRDLDLWFNGRLSVNLAPGVKEKVLVSKARVKEFKDWFTGGSHY
ncbi:MAG: LytTR family DNA-binding domain-containing protein [Bacteroidales bacterium]